MVKLEEEGLDKNSLERKGFLEMFSLVEFHLVTVCMVECILGPMMFFCLNP